MLAYDEATGTKGYYTVTAVWAHADATIVHLTIDGERIETTPEHPFSVEGKGWVPAGDLQVGDRVRQADGEHGVVEAIAFEQRPQVMYNLTADHAHTFFVGDQQWLVHNSCPVRFDPQFASRQILNQPATSGYAVTPGARTISAHAAERIAYGGPGRPSTTLEYVDQILDQGTEVVYDPIRDTIRVRATQLAGRPYVVVSASDPDHVVTVVVPR